jgi:hypothetical protein
MSQSAPHSLFVRKNGHWHTATAYLDGAPLLTNGHRSGYSEASAIRDVIVTLSQSGGTDARRWLALYEQGHVVTDVELT